MKFFGIQELYETNIMNLNKVIQELNNQIREKDHEIEILRKGGKK